MSDQKDIITFEDSLPIISHILDSFLFANLQRSIPNLYRSFSDHVRKEYLDLSPVSLLTFISWFMEKSYFFKFDQDGSLEKVYTNLSDNPEYQSLQKYIQFYTVWQLDLELNKKASLGICFASDNMLNDIEKISKFNTQFNLEIGYKFYDKDEKGVLVLNKLSSPFLSKSESDKLNEILSSNWKLFGLVPSEDLDFWELLRKHVESHNKGSKE